MNAITCLRSHHRRHSTLLQRSLSLIRNILNHRQQNSREQTHRVLNYNRILQYQVQLWKHTRTNLCGHLEKISHTHSSRKVPKNIWRRCWSQVPKRCQTQRRYYNWHPWLLSSVQNRIRKVERLCRCLKSQPKNNDKLPRKENSHREKNERYLIKTRLKVSIRTHLRTHSISRWIWD